MNLAESPEGSSPQAPVWLLPVTPGKLDRRVLDQGHFWVDIDGKVHSLNAMPPAYLINVLSVLQDNALRLHFEEMTDITLDLLDSIISGKPSPEKLAFELTGRSIAYLTPLEWLETTTFVRALCRRLAIGNT